MSDLEHSPLRPRSGDRFLSKGRSPQWVEGTSDDGAVRLLVKMIRHIGPEREQSDPAWRALCEDARKLAGIHPMGL